MVHTQETRQIIGRKTSLGHKLSRPAHKLPSHKIEAPAGNLGDLRAIMRAGVTKEALPEKTVIALIAYLHIVTCIQKDNFNLKRAEMIHMLQQLIDRQGQLYAVYER